MLRLAGVSAGDTLYDLGSGDGRVLIEAALTTGARCVGIEIDPLRCAVATLRIRAHGLGDRIRIVRGNLFDADISEADVVLCYLQQWSNDLLQEKLLAELPPHARVVTNRWGFEGLEPLAAWGRLRLYGTPGDRRHRRDGATSKRAASS
jgi:precorrin-6B methylase 2